MIDADHLCRLHSEKKVKGQKERKEGEGSGHLVPERQLWFDAQSLDAPAVGGPRWCSNLDRSSLA